MGRGRGAGRGAWCWPEGVGLQGVRGGRPCLRRGRGVVLAAVWGGGVVVVAVKGVGVVLATVWGESVVVVALRCGGVVLAAVWGGCVVLTSVRTSALFCQARLLTVVFHFQINLN